MRTWIFRSAAAGVLAGAAALSPAALGPRYGGRVTVQVAWLPDGDPASWTTAEDRLLLALTHETLYATGPDGEPRHSLAESTAAAAGGREWTLLLRSDARLHDGTPLGPADVVRSLIRFLRTPSSPAAGYLAARLEGGAAVRDGRRLDLPGLSATADAVVLRFASPEHDLRALESPAASITGPRGAAAGPFVPTSRSPGHVTLTAFGAHVRGRPLLDEVILATGAGARADLAPGFGGARAAAATLLLVLPAEGPFADLPVRLRVAEALRAAQVQRFVPFAVTPEALLTPSLLAPSLPGHAGPEVPAGPVPGRTTVSVARDVPPAASQRVLATLGAAGFATRAVVSAPDGTPAAGGVRLLAWAPEVADPALALEELALLGGGPAEVLAALAGARTFPPGPERRRALAHVDRRLRQSATVLPIAWLPVEPRAAGRLHGVRLAGATLILEDAWVEP